MSVKGCSRQGCENIMCVHSSREFGYICVECKQELQDRGECCISSFMRLEKEQKDNSTFGWVQYIDDEFINDSEIE